MIATLLFAAAAAASPTPAPESHFAYDPKALLDAVTTGVETRGDVVIQDLTFASPKGGRVPAYLVVPAGKGPFAAVVWGPAWRASAPARSRRELLDEAVVLAHSGVVSLVTEPSDDLTRQVVALRRGADLLLARPEVDPRRLAYAGPRDDGGVRAALEGVDRRFKALDQVVPASGR
jgi:hypothetical protein